MNYLELVAIKNLPYINPGDDLSKIISNALIKEPISIDDGDVIIIAQKIISKSENRYVDLSCISASRQAITLGKKLNKDPRFIQIILNESNEIISIEKNVIIVEHKLGFVHINAGIDRSNISQKIDQVLLLPKNPALSSQQLQVRLSTLLQRNISVIVTDSMTRPYRSGITNFALASSNIQSLINISSEKDIYGNLLKYTEIAVADEIAAAAGLLMGQGSDMQPVILLKGFNKDKYDINNAIDLIVEKKDDLYR
jgi:coenzyme F420-0:L-glutamate ligase / coenzyme F420-1:gamma-L-glutamate ligase